MTDPIRRRTLLLVLAAALSGAIAALAFWPNPMADGGLLPERQEPLAQAAVGVGSASLRDTDSRETRVRRTGTGVYSAPTGSVLRFRQASTMRLQMKLPGAETPVTSSMETTGSITIEVVARRDDEVLALLDFSGTTGTREQAGDVAPLVELGRELTDPVGLRLRDDGTVLGYRFGLHADATRRFVHTLMAGMLLVVPGGAEGTWSTQETDHTGRVECRYKETSADPGAREIERAKIRYLGQEVDTGGVTLARFDRDLGWVRRAETHETSSMVDPESATAIDYAASLEIELVDATMQDGRVAEFAWDATEITPSALLAGHAASEELDAGVAMRQAQAILEELDRLTATDGLDRYQVQRIIQELAELVGAQPAVLVVLKAFAFDPVADLYAVEVVLAGIATADTPHAQEFLSESLLTASLRDAVRISAATSVLALDRPSSELIGALESLWYSADDRGGELAQTGMLALGAAVGRGSPEAVQNLIAMEHTAAGRGALVDWLRAVGNAGSAEGVPAIARYLQGQESGVRHAAVDALRDIDDARVAPLLRQVLTDERDVGIRLSAARWLSRQPDASSRSMVDGLLANGTVQERLAIVAGLGDVIERADARHLVQQIAASDVHEAVRDAAQRLLSDS
jgi:hypothetical protein